jgi:hypothetical protein
MHKNLQGSKISVPYTIHKTLYQFQSPETPLQLPDRPHKNPNRLIRIRLRHQHTTLQQLQIQLRQTRKTKQPQINPRLFWAKALRLETFANPKLNAAITLIIQTKIEAQRTEGRVHPDACTVTEPIARFTSG